MNYYNRKITLNKTYCDPTGGSFLDHQKFRSPYFAYKGGVLPFHV